MPSAWPAATLLDLSVQFSIVCLVERKLRLATPLIYYSNVYTSSCEAIGAHQPSRASTDDEHVYLRFSCCGHGGGGGCGKRCRKVAVVRGGGILSNTCFVPLVFMLSLLKSKTLDK